SRVFSGNGKPSRTLCCKKPAFIKSDLQELYILRGETMFGAELCLSQKLCLSQNYVYHKTMSQNYA
ncbi:28982_t:CDS:2, partial [Racocetra persica]